jgi:HlyD family secretion protein
MTPRRRIVAGVGVAIVAVVAAVTGVWLVGPGTRGGGTELLLHGNVDIREVELAFNASERIATLHATEGQSVHAGDLLGSLDKRRPIAEVERAQAELAAQRQVVARLEAGTRDEEIRKARADVEAAEADLAIARTRLKRTEELVPEGAAPQQLLDDQRAAAEAARSRVAALRAALDLALAGPRAEDVAAARARRDALEAALTLARARLADTDLRAPVAGVIRDRILEPGDMASPQRPVYTLALTDPLWVRVYVEERDLGRFRPGLRAFVTTDSFPDRRYAGWVGRVSPTAEFTPKSVETREVRSHLVYQARVYVCDPDGELRLGMPASVHVETSSPPLDAPRCPESE